MSGPVRAARASLSASFVKEQLLKFVFKIRIKPEILDRVLKYPHWNWGQALCVVFFRQAAPSAEGGAPGGGGRCVLRAPRLNASLLRVSVLPRLG